eukprot:ANDGO_03916.mRNA.1 Putative tyrosine-protein phosphatase OCA1
MILLRDGQPQLPPLIPPSKFGYVTEHIYRGGYPTLRNFRFLQRLSLRTIVSLVPEAPTNDLIEFCTAFGIKHVHIEAPKGSILSTTNVFQIVDLLRESHDSMHNVFVHCLDGGGVSGTLIMAFRKLIHLWTVQACVEEFCTYSSEFEIETEEEEFIRDISAKEFFRTHSKQRDAQSAAGAKNAKPKDAKRSMASTLKALQPLALEGLPAIDKTSAFATGKRALSKASSTIRALLDPPISKTMASSPK